MKEYNIKSRWRMKVRITIGFVVLLAACGNEEFKSKWRYNEIIIDGSNRDWIDSLIYNKKNDIAIGVVNDETDLYINISSTDRAMIQKIMRGGLTVWFNTKGNKDKTIGIRYPIGRDGGAPMFPERFEGYENNKYPGNSPIESFETGWGEFELIKDKENMALRIPIENEIGIEVGNSFYEGMFVYELKIPLNENPDSPYAIGVSTSELIGIGFETGKMEIKNRMNRINRGGFSGGRGGRRGGRMNGGNRTPRLIKPLEYWIKVELANANS